MEHKKFKQFMHNLLPEDKIAIIHHTDPDGITSGVIINKTIQILRNKKADLTYFQTNGDVHIQEQTVQLMKKQNINKIIITDLGCDQRPDTIEQLSKFAQVLIIDHHKIYNDLNKIPGVIMIKPQFFNYPKPSAYCAAKLSFDLCSTITDINHLDWIASIGIIGDGAYKQWREFVNNTLKKYKLKKQVIYKTPLGRATTVLSAAESYNINNVKEEFKIVFNAKSYKDILNSNLKQYHKEVKAAITKAIKSYDKEAEHHKDLTFYHLKSRFFIKSTISNLISLNHPDRTIIIIQDAGDYISFSARRQDGKVEVNSLLENAVRGLKQANAGGHKPAAAGKVLREDYQKFKKNILKQTTS